MPHQVSKATSGDIQGLSKSLPQNRLEYSVWSHIVTTRIFSGSSTIDHLAWEGMMGWKFIEGLCGDPRDGPCFATIRVAQTWVRAGLR